MARRRGGGLLVLLLLAGCNDTRDLAPPSPDSPWQPVISDGATADSVGRVTGNARDAGTDLPARHFVVPSDPALPWPEHDVTIDAGRVYSLPEAIDLAQRNSKETRVAWEQARQAAISVGIARSAFLPEITSDVLAGYTHSALPFPTALEPRGYITSNGNGVFPEVALKYLLFDFGAAQATVQTAGELSFAANVAFTAAHQRLILAVARAYFMLDSADAALGTAHEALANARLVQRAADDRFAHGEGTVVEVAVARRNSAQAALGIAEATAAQHDAMHALVASIGLPPTTSLRIMDSTDRPLPRTTSANVDEMMRDALRRRPDLLAELAQLRAADAGIELARSAYAPKLSISAHVNGNIGEISVNGAAYDSIVQPEAGVFLRFDWPIYEGGRRRNQVLLAQSRRDQEEDRLEQNQDQAMREVADAYDRLETGLTRYDAAVTSQAASQTAFNAATDAYAHGIGSITEAGTAETTLAEAQADVVRSHSQVLVDAAALAFATGDLTSSDAPGLASSP